MVKNIDDNAGRLLGKLKALGIDSETMLVYLTDNGPQRQRYNAGMRGRKGTVYQGGIRVPCFVRWPAVVQPGSKVDRIAAHIDWMPTLAEACQAQLPSDRKIDGRSLMPLLRGQAAGWRDRTLFTQWHRGDRPELFRDCAARTQRWKLVNGKELYDMEADPAEQFDVAAKHPGVAAKLRAETEQWFQDVSATRGYDPPRIYLGAPQENPVLLTRQDWRGPKAAWTPESLGYWEVDVRRPGPYRVTLHFAALATDGEAVLSMGGLKVTQKTVSGATEVTFVNVDLPTGPGRLEPALRSGGAERGVQYVEVSW
jgi:arylsulfatase A-like enzyme